jgi:hypothetical protein
MSVPVSTDAGKITITTLVSLLVVFTLGIALDFLRGGNIERAEAETATSTVTVLNTPPNWTVNAQELYDSATDTPTNVGTSTVWFATATDDNGEDYFLLICNTPSAATPVGNGPPECNGGSSNRFARSATTTSGTVATASRTALAGDPESNDWWAFVCDSNAGTPQCNTTATQGVPTSTTNRSPFVVNHRPTFSLFADNSPTLPGRLVLWSSTATDTDTLGGIDTLRLFVCRAPGFDPTTAVGCTNGSWASSTVPSSVGDPTATTTITIPTVDRDYTAYGYVVDQHNLAASGGSQGTDSTLTVANATPIVSTSSISMLDTGGTSTTYLLLRNEATTTLGYQILFTVDDDNSCTTSASTTEIVGIESAVYRSGVAFAGCDTLGEYNENQCYNSLTASATWPVVCTQNTGTCSGIGDLSVDWTCTFPLWYVADPTDGGTLYPTENWRAAVQAIDDDGDAGWYAQDQVGTEVLSYLSINATGSPIAYGSLEPGDNNPLLFATTTVRATGNVGVDTTVTGNDMCPSYPNCSGNATSTIFAVNQQYGTSTLTYNTSGYSLQSTSSPELEINVRKSTATTSPEGRNTFWGIGVPAAITLAGDYVGVNTIFGVTGESSAW